MLVGILSVIAVLLLIINFYYKIKAAKKGEAQEDSFFWRFIRHLSRDNPITKVWNQLMREDEETYEETLRAGKENREQYDWLKKKKRWEKRNRK